MRAIISIYFITLFLSCNAQDKVKQTNQKIIKMNNTELVEAIIGTDKAPVVVLFGGNPYRRDEVVRLLATLGDITIYGTLGEEEGMAKIEELNRKVDVVLIGGQYSIEQRNRIKLWVAENMSGVPVTQPGFEYPYSNPHILKDVKEKAGL